MHFNLLFLILNIVLKEYFSMNLFNRQLLFVLYFKTNGVFYDLKNVFMMAFERTGCQVLVKKSRAKMLHFSREVI